MNAPGRGVAASDTRGEVRFSGDWTTTSLAVREVELGSFPWPASGELVVDTHGIARLDTAGAWLLEEQLSLLGRRGIEVRLTRLQPAHQHVLALVRRARDRAEDAPEPERAGGLERVGRYVSGLLAELWDLLAFIGETSLGLARAAAAPWTIRWRASAAQVQASGFDGLPIVGLLAFLIGVVIAYQGGVQLERYGANIFIVELVSLTIVRELGPLLAAVIVAGRTGSAIAAQLASMQVADEIDSIRVMGLDPVRLLVVPRLLGLLLALPLLTLFADIMAVFGGMVMAAALLDVSLHDFALRLPEAVSLRSLVLGLAKAPVFALVLGWVGCFQGMSAERNAQSVGSRTTRSVVEGIFLVIVADAAFSVLYSTLGI